MRKVKENARGAADLRRLRCSVAERLGRAGVIDLCAGWVPVGAQRVAAHALLVRHVLLVLLSLMVAGLSSACSSPAI